MDALSFDARLNLAVRPSPDALLMPMVTSTLPDPEWVPPAVRALFGLSPLPSLVPYAPDPCDIPCKLWFSCCNTLPGGDEQNGLTKVARERIFVVRRIRGAR